MIGKNGIITGKQFNESYQNLIIYGTPTIQDGIVSGFSNTNYIHTPQINLNDADSWEIYLKFQYIQKSGYQLPFSSNYSVMLGFSDNKMYWGLGQGSSWNLQSLVYYNTYTFENNKDYMIRIMFTGSQYKLEYSTNMVDYTTAITCSSTSKVGNVTYYRIGEGRAVGTPFGCPIDLNYFSISKNGNVIYSPAVKTGISQYQITSDEFYEL